MKFQLAVNLERLDNSLAMDDVAPAIRSRWYKWRKMAGSI